MADKAYGEPGVSSTMYESDLVPRKTGTDLVLIGNAYAPGSKGYQVDVSFAVARTRQVVRVFGNRRWKRGVVSPALSSPELFYKVPLTYEFAFGGTDMTHPDPVCHEREERNPVGRGFMARRSGRNVEDVVPPSIEDPRNLIESMEDRPAPAGFGWIGRHWKPRVNYAGTCDAKWMETRSPLLPEDFDERYYSGAHPMLVTKGFLKGTEPVEVINATPSGTLTFTSKTPLEVKLDTLVVEPDQGRAVTLWRGSMDLHNKLYDTMRIEVGP
jgi:hypothetical protein